MKFQIMGYPQPMIRMFWLRLTDWSVSRSEIRNIDIPKRATKMKGSIQRPKKMLLN